MSNKKESVVIYVDGKAFEFSGDELTSPEQEAILFLKELDSKKAEF